MWFSFILPLSEWFRAELGFPAHGSQAPASALATCDLGVGSSRISQDFSGNLKENQNGSVLYIERKNQSTWMIYWYPYFWKTHGKSPENKPFPLSGFFLVAVLFPIIPPWEGPDFTMSNSTSTRPGSTATVATRWGAWAELGLELSFVLSKLSLSLSLALSLSLSLSIPMRSKQTIVSDYLYTIYIYICVCVCVCLIHLLVPGENVMFFSPNGHLKRHSDQLHPTQPTQRRRHLNPRYAAGQLVLLGQCYGRKLPWWKDVKNDLNGIALLSSYQKAGEP